MALGGAFNEKLELILTGNAAGAIRAFAESAVAAEESAAKTEAANARAAASTKKTGEESELAGKKHAAAGEASGMSATKMAATTAVAGIAVVGALFEMSKKWEEAALAAGKMGDATGLTTEQASRWIVVAQNSDVSTQALEKSIGFMDKTMGKTPETFAKWGVALRDSHGTALSVNDVLLNLINRLHNTTDEGDKAAMGAALLGKGWQATAELIGQGSGKIVEDLAKVNKAQVFDERAYKQAQDYRDKLKDVENNFKAIELQVGVMAVPLMHTFADWTSELLKLDQTLTNTDTVAGKAATGIGRMSNQTTEGAGIMKLFLADVKGTMSSMPDAMGNAQTWGKAVDPAITAIKAVKDAQDVVAVSTKEAAKMTADYEAALNRGSTAMYQGTGAAEKYTRAQAEAKTAVDDLTGAIKTHAEALQKERDAALGAIDKKYAYIQANSAAIDSVGVFEKVLADHKSTLKDIGDASLVNGLKIRTASQAWADSQGDIKGSSKAINDQIGYLYTFALTLDPNSPLRKQLQGFIADLQGVVSPPPITVTLDTSQASSAVASLTAAMANIRTGVAIPVTTAPAAAAKNVPTPQPTPVGVHAAGTDYFQGGRTWVGERGPEILDLPGGSRITPNDRLGLGAPAPTPISVVVNVAGTVVTSQDLAMQLADTMTALVRRGVLMPNWATG